MKKRIMMLGSLIINDLKSRYSGSAFGMIWAYVQPLVTMLVFWFVFQKGFRNPPVENVEYILWFAAGYIPWIFFSDGVMASSNVFYEYAYLVKKMKFEVWKLPIIKVFSSFCIHLFFVFFLFSLYMLYGNVPDLAWFSVFYYSLSMVLLLLGIGYLISSFSVLFKDVSQLVNIILQLGFWVTPVFWSESSMNEGILRILRWNPMFFILKGYRDSLINGISFWEQDVYYSCVFWCEVFILLILGIVTYRKLRVHFSDLL